MFSWGHLYLTYNPQVIEPVGEASQQRAVPPPRQAHGHRRSVVRSQRRRAARASARLDGPADGRASRSTGLRTRGLRPARPCPTPTTTRRTRRGVPDAVGQGRAGRVDGGRRQLRRTAVPPGHRRQPGRRPRRRAARRTTRRGSSASTPAIPLALVCPRPHAFLNSQYGNMDRQLHQQGEQTCRMHHRRRRRPAASRTATPVRVFNDRSEITAVAVVTTTWRQEWS